MSQLLTLAASSDLSFTSKDAASDESRFINKNTFEILNMSIHLKVGCFAYQIKAINSAHFFISTGFETAAKIVLFYFI